VYGVLQPAAGACCSLVSWASDFAPGPPVLTPSANCMPCPLRNALGAVISDKGMYSVVASSSSSGGGGEGAVLVTVTTPDGAVVFKAPVAQVPASLTYEPFVFSGAPVRQ
jgi:hypothetical protein